MVPAAESAPNVPSVWLVVGVENAALSSVSTVTATVAPAPTIELDPRYLDSQLREFCQRAQIGEPEALARAWIADLRKNGITAMPATIAAKQFAAWLKQLAKAQRKG